MVGVQDLKPIIGEPPAGTAAARAELPRGATILKINDDPVTTWQEVRLRMLQLALAKSPVRLEIISPKQEISWHDLDVTQLHTGDMDGDLLRHLGLLLFRPEVPPIIGNLVAGGPAERAGFQVGDKILRIDGSPVTQPDQVVSKIRQSIDKRITASVARGSQQLEILVEPEAADDQGLRIGRIGAGIAADPEAMRAMVVEIRYGPFESIVKALEKTWETSLFSVRMTGRLLTGDISPRNISGPLTIADYAGRSAQRGLAYYLDFLGLISISLGVLNLLPIPLLDGGNMMYYVIEIVRGRAVSERALEIGQQVGLFLLLTLMAFAFYNDISRLLSS